MIRSKVDWQKPGTLEAMRTQGFVRVMDDCCRNAFGCGSKNQALRNCKPTMKVAGYAPYFLSHEI